MRSFVTILLCCCLAGTAVAKGIKVGTVTVKGNEAFPDTRVRGAMISRTHHWYAPSPYHPEVLADDLLNIAAVYRQHGYLSAAVDSYQVRIDTVRQRADISISVTEGPLTMLEGVSVFGSTVFPESTLIKKAGIKPGGPLRQTKIKEAAGILLRLYADNGYLDAAVDPELKIEDTVHRALVNFNISEGPCYIIGSIVLAGTTKVRSRIILRECAFAAGDTVRYGALLKSQRSLFLTGLFEGVYIKPVPSADSLPGIRDIRVEVKEKKSISLDLSAGYGTRERVRVKGSLTNANLQGTGRQAGCSALASFVARRTEVSFSEPWVLGWPVKADARLEYGFADEPGYDIEQWGGRLVAGRHFGRRSSVTCTYRYENAFLSDVTAAGELPEIDTRIRSLILGGIYDSRDNLFNSTSGVLFSGQCELAGAFMQGTDTFLRLTANTRYFRPLGTYTVWGIAFGAGWMGLTGSGGTVPLSERFYAGGPSDLRGFGYHLAGPTDTEGDPVGGVVRCTATLSELRFPVYRTVGAALFLDAGNVWSDAGQVTLRTVRWCPGAGLRINTPLGTVRADAGFIINPLAGMQNWQIHATVGQAF